MGNKTALNNITSVRFSKPHANNSDGIYKKTQAAKPSRVGKKAREILRKNFELLSINTLLKFNSNNSMCIKNNTYKLPATEQEDEASHQTLSEIVNSGMGLHSLLNTTEKFKGILPLIPVDLQPHTWRDTVPEKHYKVYGFNPKQIKYQEILYEIILTEQSYVDDLILIYEIFIKEAVCWSGLLLPVERLFRSITNIIELHFRLLEAKEFRIYFSYFREFEKANTLIQKSINRQDEFGSYISRRSSWLECKNLPFSAYLLKPIQRIMKYPLFFKSLSDCLAPNDGEIPYIQIFLSEIDELLRCFEKEKKEADEFMKLEDLSCRIKGLEGSTIHIAEPKRKLIYEGYLTIVPQNNQQASAFSRMNSSTISFASTADTPRLRRKNSTFNLSSKRQDKAYVFLFNDFIVCTRERNKKKPVVLDERGAEVISKKGSYYGPSPNSLFEIIHAPGKITMVDRHVAREICAPPTGKLSRKGSVFLQSFKRYGSRVTDDDNNSIMEDPTLSFPGQQSMASIKQDDSFEEHPLQFVCSIATKNLANVHFEAETVEEKSVWCNHFERVLKDHVQRDYPSSSPKCARTSGSSNDSTLCSNNRFSIKSTASKQVTMDIDSDIRSSEYNTQKNTENDDSFYKQNETLPTLINRLTIFNDNSFYNTLLDDFGDKSWTKQ